MSEESVTQHLLKRKTKTSPTAYRVYDSQILQPKMETTFVSDTDTSAARVSEKEIQKYYADLETTKTGDAQEPQEKKPVFVSGTDIPLITPSTLKKSEKFALFLSHSGIGLTIDIIQVIFSLAACVAYVVETYVTTESGKPNTTIVVIEVVLASFFIIDWLLHFYVANSKMHWVMSWPSLIDFVTVIPVFAYVFDSSTDSAVALSFLRVFRVARVFRIMRAYRVVVIQNAPLIRAITKFSFVVLTYIFVSTGIFHFIENVEADTNVDFHDALYFTILTLTTVGLAGIKPTSVLSKMFVSLDVIAFLIVLFIGAKDIFRFFRYRSFMNKSYNKSKYRNKFVLLVYDCEESIAASFFKQFFSDIRTQDITILVLSQNDPPPKLDQFLKLYNKINSIKQRNIKWMKGSALDENDLNRCNLDYCSGCFVMSNHLASDLDAEDQKTILKALSIKRYNSLLKVCVKLIKSTNKIHLLNSNIDVVISIDDLQSSIFGQSCLFPGFSTLVAALSISPFSVAQQSAIFAKTHEEEKNKVNDDSTLLEPWQNEFLYGLKHELFSLTTPSGFIGMSFSQAAALAYLRYRCIMLAIEIEIGDEMRVVINPGDSYTIEGGELIFIVARSRTAALKISRHGKPLVIDKSNKKKNKNKNKNKTKDGEMELDSKNEPKESSDLELADNQSQGLTRRESIYSKKIQSILTTSQKEQILPNNNNNNKNNNNNNDNNDNNDNEISLESDHENPKTRQEAKDIQKQVKKAKSIGNILRVDAHPQVSMEMRQLYHLLDEPLTIQDQTIQNVADDLENLNQHLVICANWRTTFSLYHFIKPLRYRIFRNIKPVVILSPHPPPQVVWDEIKNFPEIYYIHGDYTKLSDLRKAGVELAGEVAILCKNDTGLSDEAMDNENLITYLLIRNNFRKEIFTITELQKPENIKFFEIPKYSDYDLIYSPSFASGKVFSPIFFDGLLIKSFLNISANDLVREFIIPTPLPLTSHVKSSVISQFLVPAAFVGKKFQTLFRTFISHNVIAIGIYRGTLSKKGDFSYVVLCPKPDDILFRGDRIYLLSVEQFSDNQSLAQQLLGSLQSKKSVFMKSNFVDRKKDEESDFSLDDLLEKNPNETQEKPKKKQSKVQFQDGNFDDLGIQLESDKEKQK